MRRKRLCFCSFRDARPPVFWLSCLASDLYPSYVLTSSLALRNLTPPPPPLDHRRKTVDVSTKGMTSKSVADACEAKGINVRIIDDKTVGLSFGESITKSDVGTLVRTEGQEEGRSLARPNPRSKGALFFSYFVSFSGRRECTMFSRSTPCCLLAARKRAARRARCSSSAWFLELVSATAAQANEITPGARTSGDVFYDTMREPSVRFLAWLNAWSAVLGGTAAVGIHVGFMPWRL